MRLLKNIELSIAPKHSKSLLLFMVILHSAAALSVITLPFSYPLNVLLVLLVSGSLIISLQLHYWRRSRFAIKAAILDKKDGWQLLKTDGTIVPVKLLDTYLVHPKLVVLNFGRGWFYRRSLILPKDSLDLSDFRQLRLYLLNAKSLLPGEVQSR